METTKLQQAMAKKLEEQRLKEQQESVEWIDGGYSMKMRKMYTPDQYFEKFLEQYEFNYLLHGEIENFACNIKTLKLKKKYDKALEEGRFFGKKFEDEIEFLKEKVSLFYDCTNEESRKVSYKMLQYKLNEGKTRKTPKTKFDKVRAEEYYYFFELLNKELS